MWSKILKYFAKHKLIAALILSPIALVAVWICARYLVIGVARMAGDGMESRMHAGGQYAYCKEHMKHQSYYGHDMGADAVREAKVQMKVADVEAVLLDMQTIATAKGGYLETTHVSHAGEKTYGKVVLRVPVSEFSDAFEHVKGRASEILNEWTAVNDLGADAMGVDARMGQLIRYDSGMVGPELVVLQQQARELSKQMVLAAINVEMWEERRAGVFEFEEDPMVALENASESALDDLRSYSSILIKIVLKLPIIMIWALTLGVIWFVVRQFMIRVRKETGRATRKK